MKNHPRGSKGLTLVEIMIVVAVLGFLIAISIPGFKKTRNRSQQRACQENLQEVDGAKVRWALAENESDASTPTWEQLAGATKSLREIPECPAGGTYKINNVATDPVCSLSSSGHALP